MVIPIKMTVNPVKIEVICKFNDKPYQNSGKTGKSYCDRQKWSNLSVKSPKSTKTSKNPEKSPKKSKIGQNWPKPPKTPKKPPKNPKVRFLAFFLPF